MSEPKLRYTGNQQPVHYSVGAFIRNEEGMYLLIDRLKKPFGFACPAGHVDEDESDLIAILREFQEETGLKLIGIKQINLGDYCDAPQETCSRGISHHIWSLYEIEAKGDFIFKADEVKSIGWYTIEQIKELQLESIWYYWFNKLNKLNIKENDKNRI